MESERLIALSPRERRVIVGNISAIFQEIKLRTLTILGIVLGEQMPEQTIF